MTDEALHEAIILLEEWALSEWQARNGPLVIGWLVKRGIPRSDAEEIWNDVLTATVKAAVGLTPLGVSLRRYAFGVARKMAADRIEQLARHAAQPLDESLPAPSVRPSPPDPRRIDALRRCLALAPERYRLAFELTSEGTTVDELATVFAIQRDSVYQVQHRARLWLQRCILEELS